MRRLHKRRRLVPAAPMLFMALGALALNSVGVNAAPDAVPGSPPATNPGPNPPLPDAQHLSPEQRQQIMQQMRLQARDDNLKRMLSNAGFPDPQLQANLIGFIKSEESASQAYREKGRKLIAALRSKALSDAQLAMLLNEFRAAAEDERQRRTIAQEALDKKIGYTKNPRLEVYLRLLGLVGDEASLLIGTGNIGNADL